MKNILITGAAGRVGTTLTRHFAGHHQIRLTDIRPPKNTRGYQFIEAGVENLEAMQAACREIDIVIHLAADPSAASDWESILPSNVIGTYNVFQAAHEAGCQRVIFASSVHTVWAYPTDVQVNPKMPVRPDSLYGASKVWGEAVASVYAYKHGLSAICLRMGWIQAYDSPLIKPENPELDILLTYRDLVKLFEACVNAPADVHFGIFNGTSNNRRSRLDIGDTRSVLGYAPRDDAFNLAGIVTD